MYALASFGSPRLLRGRHGTMYIAKGSDVRPGVPWGSAAFAWQAWDNAYCQWVWCMPWHPLGLRLFCVVGMKQCTLLRDLMYVLVPLGTPPFLWGRCEIICTTKGFDICPGVPWGFAFFRGRRRLTCTAKLRDVRLVPWGSAAFAWQAWQRTLPRDQMYVLASLRALPLLRGRRGIMCTVKGLIYPLASIGAPSLFRGRRGIIRTAKGSDICPGVPWGSTFFCMAGVRQYALTRGLIYALASIGAPSLFRGRRGIMWTAKGSDICPGVPWGSTFFCMAGVRQYALIRGLIYALASIGAPPFLRGRRGTICFAKGSDKRPGVPGDSASLR